MSLESGVPHPKLPILPGIIPVVIRLPDLDPEDFEVLDEPTEDEETPISKNLLCDVTLFDVPLSFLIALRELVDEGLEFTSGHWRYDSFSRLAIVKAILKELDFLRGRTNTNLNLCTITKLHVYFSLQSGVPRRNRTYLEQFNRLSQSPDMPEVH